MTFTDEEIVKRWLPNIASKAAFARLMRRLDEYERGVDKPGCPVCGQLAAEKKG